MQSERGCMVYENRYCNIYYNECDRSYINKIVEAINSNLKRILEFFEIIEFKHKKLIKVWSNLEAYKGYLIPFVDEYFDWMVADTYDTNINILSYNLYIFGGHKNCNLSDYIKIIIHELVHACQQEINSNARNVVWFWEALATNLSNQQYLLINISYSKEDIMFNYNILQDSYAASYTIGKYLLLHYNHSQIIEYVKNPEKLINDTDHILENTKLWLRKSFEK